jgi:hypothetical protein
LLTGNAQTPTTSNLVAAQPGNDWQTTRFRGLIVPSGEFVSDSTAPGGFALQRYGDVGYGSLLDGSSNTLMFGEKGAWSTNYNPVQNSRYANGNNFFSNIELRGIVGPFHANARGVFGNGAAAFPDNDRGLPQLGGFGSAHPGTFNVVLGDGSTHTVSMDVLRLDFVRLGIRNDGDITNINEL